MEISYWLQDYLHFLGPSDGLFWAQGREMTIWVRRETLNREGVGQTDDSSYFSDLHAFFFKELKIHFNF